MRETKTVQELHKLIQKGDVGAIRTFIGQMSREERQDAINQKIRTKTGSTHKDKSALHVAARQGNPEIVQLLLDYGGDPTLQITVHEDTGARGENDVYEGKTALQEAGKSWVKRLFSSQRREAINILEAAKEKGVQPQESDRGNNYPYLSEAALRDNERMLSARNARTPSSEVSNAGFAQGEARVIQGKPGPSKG